MMLGNLMSGKEMLGKRRPWSSWTERLWRVKRLNKFLIERWRIARRKL